MNNPKLYLKANNLQSTISKEVLEENLELFKNSGGEVIDLGCGTGNVTCEILYPLLPKSLKRLLAVDISPKMIKTASQRYKDHPKIQFGILDVSREIPNDLQNRFDHVYSFFCLHWIQDQRLAMKNIFDLLKPGGDAFFILPTKADQLYKNYQTFYKDPRWQKYMYDLDTYLLPYRDEPCPERALRSHLEDANLTIKFCKPFTRDFSFDDEGFRGFLESVNPFVGRMSKDEKEEFLTMLLERAKKDDPKREDGDGETVFYLDMLLVHVCKEVSE